MNMRLDTNGEVMAVQRAFGKERTAAIEKELRRAESEGREPRIRLSEADASRLEEARAEIKRLDEAIARTIAASGITEEVSACFSERIERFREEEPMTDRQIAEHARVLLGEEGAATDELSSEDREAVKVLLGEADADEGDGLTESERDAALRLAEGV
jgi:hypothetical protein